MNAEKKELEKHLKAYTYFTYCGFKKERNFQFIKEGWYYYSGFYYLLKEQILQIHDMSYEQANSIKQYLDELFECDFKVVTKNFRPIDNDF